MLIIVFTLLSLGYAGSVPKPDEIPPEIELRRGMWILNTWAMANIATGIPPTFNSSDVKKVAFYQMNAGWNLVNLGLASTALLRKKPVVPEKMSKIFWINSGLDVVYIVGGILLAKKGGAGTELEGWGDSIVIQGGFLLVFDSVMGWRMQRYVQKYKL